MEKEIRQCLQRQMDQAPFSDGDRQNLVAWTLSQNTGAALWPKRAIGIAIALLAVLAMLGFVGVFAKGDIPDFFLDRSLLTDRVGQTELYQRFLRSGKLKQYSDQLQPGELGSVTYRSVRGSMEAIVLRGDTLDAVIPSFHGEAPTWKATFYHDRDKQDSGRLTQDGKSNNINVLEDLIQNGAFAAYLPAERYAFQWITTYGPLPNGKDSISMICYKTPRGRDVTMTFRPTSSIYRDLDNIRGENVTVAGRSFVFVTSDKSFETIEEIYHFFESDYEHQLYSHVAIVGRMRVEEAMEIAGDLLIVNEEGLPIPGVDGQEASAFLDSFPDQLLKDNRDSIVGRLERMGRQEEGIVWEQEGRSVKTRYGNPFELVVELAGLPYSEAALVSPHRPLPFEDFPWFPADSFHRVKSYYDATVYEFAPGTEEGVPPYCSIQLVEDSLQAQTQLDMLIGSHFFLTEECKITERNGVRYLVTKQDEATVAIGAIAEDRGQCYYYRMSIPIPWLDGTDWDLLQFGE